MYAVTFYSYKGGVGRSLLVANCAVYLAQLGLRVVALDLDLEAPGLHYKFRTALLETSGPARGIVDLIDDYANKNQLYESLLDASFEVSLGDPMLEPNEPRPGGMLRVIPAGAAPSLEYWRRLTSIDWKRFLYDEGATGVEFFVDLRDRIAEEFKPDLLLIDSRTGITEIGNVATSVLADKVVCIVTDTAENLEGSRAVLRGLRRYRRLSDEAPIEMKIAVSRPHPSLSMSERLEKIRAFLEEPADMLDSTLSVGTPYPLTHDPDVEQQERLVLGGSLERMGQLSLDYMALAEELVPEPLWSDIRTSWAPRIQSPYPYSVWSYSRLALEQPGIPIDGLYRVGRRCYIVVPGFRPDMRASDGKSLLEWFRSEKVLGPPIEIVDRAPNGSVPVPEPSLEDLIELRDAPRTFRQVDFELCLKLPRDFPRFVCARGEHSSQVVEVERPLRADERAALRRVLASLQYGPMLRPVIRVNTNLVTHQANSRSVHAQGDTSLVPSRRLPSAFSSAVLEMVAHDEEVWMASRQKIHRGEITEASAVLPFRRKGPGGRLLAGSNSFTVPGAHRLLPLCDQLIVTCPLEGRVDEELKVMGFTREDLVTLAGEERIIVLLPQSIDRYEAALLNDLVHQAPESLVFSRALCAATMVELRRRLYPWFFPGFDLGERRERLRRAMTSEQAAASPLSSLLPTLVSRALSHLWARGEYHTHEKGAMASGYLGGGFGTLLAAHVEHELKREMSLESTEAGASVERAAALGAILIPMHRPEFSLLGLTTWGAALMSSLSDVSAHSIPSLTFTLPDQDARAMDLAHIDHEDLCSVRAFLADVTEGTHGANLTAETAAEALRRGLELSCVLTKPGDKLTLTAPTLNLNQASGDGVVLARALRDMAAGAEPLRPGPGVPNVSVRFPPIVVGSVVTSIAGGAMFSGGTVGSNTSR